jgi:hypothetical protein
MSWRGYPKYVVQFQTEFETEITHNRQRLKRCANSNVESCTRT